MSVLRLDPRRDPLRVLLVEDDEDDFVFIRDLLEETPERRYDVEWVDCYEEGLERMAENRHHVYLVDYRLGARTGVELLQEDAVAGLAAPVIVLTGVGERRADEEAMRAGASDFLTKGRVDEAVLERAIRYAVEGKRQEEFQRFLADATRVLNASLEFETSVGAAARIVVPALADWSCLYLEATGESPPVAEVVHADPTKDEASARLAELARERSPSPPTRDAMERGRALVLQEVGEEELRGWIDDDEYRSLLEQLGMRSAVVAPLRGKGGVLGALILVSRDADRRYREADRPFFEELGRRVALALENARLFEAARQATRIRDEVLSMVSHDLGNPLAAVSMAAGRIESRLEEVDDERISRLVEMIRSATDSMERLIEDLLDVGGIETGRHFGVERRPEAVPALLGAAVERLRSRAEAKEVGFELDPADAVPEVMVDRERVLQVMSNLLSNALKFSESGTTVRVGAATEDGAVRISVRDRGVGMSEEEMEHLFDRFWQARRHRRAGAGLGLTITREIVEAHGGRIWAESREGEGSTFHFTLPTVEASDLES